MRQIVFRRAVDVVMVVVGVAVLLWLMSVADGRATETSARGQVTAAPTTTSPPPTARATSADVVGSAAVGYVAIVGAALAAGLYVVASRRLDAKAGR